MQPNILLILSDQEQNFTRLPDELRRPGFDWLQQRGVSFVNHHVTTLPCGPSRSTIYTGQHTQHAQVLSNPNRDRGIGLAPSIPTIGTMLREQGYYTAYKGKWHVSVIDRPAPFAQSAVDALEEYGFSEYTSDGDPVGIAWDGFRQDPAVAADAANWLAGFGGHRPRHQPWFLAVNFVNPHDVMFFDASGRMNDIGAGGMRTPRLPAPPIPIYQKQWSSDLPASFGDNLEQKPSSQLLRRQLLESRLGAMAAHDEELWRRYRDYYFNCIVDLDRNVDMVLQALRDSGQLDNTVIVYTTDHGEAAGAHGLREKPTSVYREVVNIPLVVVHPDASSGTTTSALSSTVDVAPTLLSCAGLSADVIAERYPHVVGHSQMAAVMQPESPGPRQHRGVLFNMSHAGPYDSKYVMAKLRQIRGLTRVEAGVSLRAAALTVSTASLVGIATRVLSGVVSDRVRRPSIGLELIGGLLLLLAFSSLFMAGKSTSIMIVGVVVGYGGGWGYSALLQHTIVSNFPGRVAQSTGVVAMGTSLGQSVGPLLFIAISSATSTRTAWTAVALSAFIGALFAFNCPSDVRSDHAA